MRPTLLFLIACLGLVGCADVPELDTQITPAARSAPYPRLQPLDPILATGLAGQSDTETAEALRARAASLQARAARLP